MDLTYVEVSVEQMENLLGILAGNAERRGDEGGVEFFLDELKQVRPGYALNWAGKRYIITGDNAGGQVPA